MEPKVPNQKYEYGQLIRVLAGLYPEANLADVRDAGFTHVRHEISWPWVDKVGGDVSADFLRDRARIQDYIDAGLSVMGIVGMLGVRKAVK